MTISVGTSHLCVVCGETNPQNFYGHSKSNCRLCRNQQTIQRGRERRQYGVDLLGGKCVVCGFNDYSEALDFHHLDPALKDPNFSSLRGWSKKRIRKELETCVLLCSNCHRAEHAGYDLGDLSKFTYINSDITCYT